MAISKNTINLLHSHPAIETHEIIRKICTPLFNFFNLTFFRYLRMYPDKSRIHLCTNPEWTAFFYSKGFYNIAWFDVNALKAPNSIEILWDVKASTEDNIVGIEARNHFNIYHGISIIRPQKSYYEVYDLATHKENIAINDLYSNNVDLLERFFFYFKDQARSLLQKCDKSRIKLPNLDDQSKLPKIYANYKEKNKFVDLTQTKRFYINTSIGDTYLTKKEIKCIYWILNGKSADEVSIICNCSKRTIEEHLSNIKQKLGVSKITLAIKILIDSGIINAFKLELDTHAI